MTEQQQHLTSLLEQRNTLQSEMEKIQTTANSKRELFWKVQGAIEYLVQTGVTLPEPEEPVEGEEETEETEE